MNARIAARLHQPDAQPALRTALDALEENARRMPIDCDRAFRRLAAAAQESGERAIAERALSRNRHYEALRQAAASLEVEVT
jgi:AAA+ superfamily predicted ATPase